MRTPNIVRTATAWELIGFEGEGPEQWVRVKGGRTLYEAVFYQDGNKLVKLGRIDTSEGFLNQIYRWVDPDTLLEVVA